MSNNCSPTTITARIYVYKGWGLDWTEKRHTLLSFSFADGSKSVIINAAGSTGGYRVEIIDPYDPSQDRYIVGEALVGTLVKQISRSELISFVEGTPVNNNESGWNCQNWVGDALDRMLAAGWITRNMLDEGLDGMADIIVEAKDEHLR